MREFVNRVRMNMGAMPAFENFVGPEEEVSHEKVCPHQKIYGAGHPARIDFAAFLKDLATNANIPPEVIRINFQNIFLSRDTAVYCGFIMKELFANFIRLKPKGQGVIIFDLCRRGADFNLSISARGNRFETQAEFHDSESLSARLIMFLTQQINGSMNFDGSSEFGLSFREPGLLESLQL